MNKLIKPLFLCLTLAIGNYALGQDTQAKFVSSDKPVAIANEQGIEATYVTGRVNNTPSVSFAFKNSGNQNIAFLWTLVDKNNVTAYTSHIYKIAPGQAINADNTPQDMNMLVLPLKPGSQISDYHLVIKIKGSSKQQ